MNLRQNRDLQRGTFIPLFKDRQQQSTSDEIVH
jgi:hypothetical protein